MFDADILQMEPRKALVFYGQQAGYIETIDFVQAHNIDKRGNIEEGKPVSQNCMRDLLASFYEEYQASIETVYLYPERLLAFNPALDFMCWYAPKQERAIFFQNTSYMVKWPALVFMVRKDDIYIFATKSNKRPDANTPLYHAPIWNTYDDGSMCKGSAVFGNRLSPEYMRQWQDGVYNSTFTHPNGSIARIKGVERGAEESFWAELSKSGKSFPSAKLYPFVYDETGEICALEDMISKTIEG